MRCVMHLGVLDFFLRHAEIKINVVQIKLNKYTVEKFQQFLYSFDRFLSKTVTQPYFNANMTILLSTLWLEYS